MRSGPGRPGRPFLLPLRRVPWRRASRKTATVGGREARGESAESAGSILSVGGFLPVHPRVDCAEAGQGHKGQKGQGIGAQPEHPGCRTMDGWCCRGSGGSGGRKRMPAGRQRCRSCRGNPPRPRPEGERPDPSRRGSCPATAGSQTDREPPRSGTGLRGGGQQGLAGRVRSRKVSRMTLSHGRFSPPGSVFQRSSESASQRKTMAENLKRGSFRPFPWKSAE